MAFIIAGLGNPGSQYENNRHNIGYMLVDYLSARYGLQWSRCKWDGDLSRSTLWGERVCLIKPSAYMNRSGKAVAGISNFYGIKTDDILVVHDDLDMGVGRLKLVKGGGTGGHNGIRSIVQDLGSGEFYRLKIGIGRPGNSGVHPDMPVDAFVLSDFTEEESALIKERIVLAEEGVELLVKGDHKRAMTTLNCIK
jgi:PTH1 family peptidyl-tRNA hydrolase